MALKEFKILSLMLVPNSGQYVVFLEEVGGARMVPIWIGLYEGNAILLHLQGEELPRPMTHDLLVNLTRVLGVEIERVVVNDLVDNTYYALIEANFEGQHLSIDARPSDSMAIAVRVGAPIYVHERVLEKGVAVMKPITEEELESFKEELKNIRPEDFLRGLGEEEGGEAGA
ncbi:MAG: bifunctional nuclease family protein [Nitrospirae bacterium]|nr:MAG: bifunctional nuclease family protein [Nitrospirota bacterium]